MDHLSQFPTEDESECLSIIGILDSHKLEEQLRSGVISRQEYKNQVYELAARRLIERLQISTPGLAAPNLNDKDFNLQEYLKILTKAKLTDEAHQNNLRENVRKKTPALVSKIFDDWENLQAIVGAYRDVLSRRWSKKRVDKRKSLLLQAWPAMPPVHRPDFDVLRRRLKGLEYRDLIMLPYINLEDLSSERHLLQLLDSRTKKPPEHFAWSDSAPFKAAVRVQAVRDDPGSSEVMLLTEKKTRESYGSLQVLTSQAEIEDIVWTEYGFQLCRGFTVLETQVKLYGFLLNMAKLLLQDINLSGLTTGTNVIHTSRKMEQDAKPREWLSITEANTQAFYDLPQPFSLTSLRRLVDAKRDEAQDSFWTLHEDPAFFQTQVVVYQSLIANCQRRVLESKPLSVVYKAESGALKNAWCRIVLKTCQDIVTWNALATEITGLEKLRASLHIDQRPLSKRLPSEYENAISRLFCLMTFLWKLAVKDLYLVAVFSPKLVDYFDFVPSTKGAFSTIELKESMRDQWPPILHLLLDLSLEETSMFMGVMGMLEEMQRILNSDPYHCASIHAPMMEEISKLAALAQIRDAHYRHQPSV